MVNGAVAFVGQTPKVMRALRVGTSATQFGRAIKVVSFAHVKTVGWASQKYANQSNLIGEGVSPDANQDEENIIPIGRGKRDSPSLHTADRDHSAFASGPISTNALGVRVNAWGEHPADYLDNRYDLHGGLVRFFIKRWNRPKMVYISSSSRIFELRFRNEKDQVIKRKINFLTLYVGNKGKSDALKPRIGLALEGEKQKWASAMFSDFVTSGLPFREILVKTDEDLELISEPQLAYELVANGLRHADSLMKTWANTFIIAFAFQDSKQFYFASENLAPMPLGEKTVKVTLSGHARNMPPMRLSYNFNFLLTLENWKDMSIATTEEEF